MPIGISRKTSTNKGQAAPGKSSKVPLTTIIVLSHPQRNHLPLIRPAKKHKKNGHYGLLLVPLSRAPGSWGYQSLHPLETFAVVQTKHLAGYEIC